MRGETAAVLEKWESAIRDAIHRLRDPSGNAAALRGSLSFHLRHWSFKVISIISTSTFGVNFIILLFNIF
jgi:hypothetical protein